MNLAALRAAVRARLGVPSTDPLLTDPAVNELVNAASHHLETEWDWPWLETTEDLATAIGVATVAPGATWMRTLSLKIAAGVTLRRAPIEEVDFLAGPGTGEPRLWCATGALITLFPTPSAVVTLKHRFVRSEPDLVVDGDTPLVPVSFRSAIVEYAAVLSYRRTRDEERAAGPLAAYEAWVEQMKRRSSRYADTHGGGAEAAVEPAK